MKIYLEKKVSKTGEPYITLYGDLGFKSQVISFNDSDIAMILGVSVKSLYDYECDSPIEVASLEVY